MDGVAVDTRATDLDGDGAEALAAEAPAADNGLEADGQPPPAIGTVDIGRSPPSQSRAQYTTAYEHTVAPNAYDSLPHHGKPPPAGMV